MSFSTGDRVQFDEDGPGTATSEGQEVLLRGHTGTVVGLQASEAAVVEWDAGTYEVYGDLVPSPSGMKAVSSGDVELRSFEAAVHTDYLSPAPGES